MQNMQFEYRPVCARERINNEKAPAAHMEMRIRTHTLLIRYAFHKHVEKRSRPVWVGGAHAHIKRSTGKKRRARYLERRHVGDGAVGLDGFQLVQTPVQLLHRLHSHLHVTLICNTSE